MATSDHRHQLAMACRLTLFTTAAVALLSPMSVAQAEICFRKYNAERNACKGQVHGQGHFDVETCCAEGKSVQGQGYATELVRHATANKESGKKWFECTPCSDRRLLPVSNERLHLTGDNTGKKPTVGVKYDEEEVDRMQLPPFQTKEIMQQPRQSDDSSDVQPAEKNNSKQQLLSVDLLDGASRLRSKELKTNHLRAAFGERLREKTSSGSVDKKIWNVPSSLGFKKNAATDNVWSQWSEWGPCSVTCGDVGGKQQRTRFCLSGNCRDGSDYEERSCSGSLPCPVDGAWTEWSDWSTCNVTCDWIQQLDSSSNSVGGLQHRTRSCDGPSPQYGGADCVGPREEFKQCVELPVCPVDGGWSDWTNWTQCSTSCGEGQQTRSRQCDNPVPRHGGRPCEGLELESAPCIIRPDCPVDGDWSDWSRMETCSAKSCSGQHGFRIRFRSCTNPRPTSGGLPCRGRSWTREICYNNDFCTELVDGGWCLWSDWSVCDDQIHIMTRARNCTCPPPVNGGATCRGDSIEKKSCTTIHPTLIFPTAAVDRSHGCHGESSGDGSDIECDMEQDESHASNEAGSGTE